MYTCYEVSNNANAVAMILFVCEYRQERSRIAAALSKKGVQNCVRTPRLEYMDCAVAVESVNGNRQFTILSVPETLAIMRNKQLRKTEVNMKKRYHM